MEDKIENNVVALATQKKYTEFADSVKQMMQDKLDSHEYMQAHNAEIDRIASLKSAFQGINNNEE